MVRAIAENVGREDAQLLRLHGLQLRDPAADPGAHGVAVLDVTRGVTRCRSRRFCDSTGVRRANDVASRELDSDLPGGRNIVCAMREHRCILGRVDSRSDSVRHAIATPCRTQTITSAAQLADFCRRAVPRRPHRHRHRVCLRGHVSAGAVPGPGRHRRTSWR